VIRNNCAIPEMLTDPAQESCVYRVDRVSLDQVRDHEAARPRTYPRLPAQNPEWVKGYFADQLQNLSIYSISQSGGIAGTASFLLLDWPLKCYLGELAVAAAPLNRLRLLGGSIDMPEETSAYDALFAQLRARPDFDCLYFEEVSTDSFLWKYLHTGTIPSSHFIAYQPEPPALRPILQFGESFESYMQKFTSKHRGNIRRQIRKLREGPLGEMRLARYERTDQVREFVDLAIAVSRKTYQWKIHQRGLSDTDRVARRLSFAAEHGWMRCYLLFCGDTPYAFLTGYQHEGCFLMDEIGHDPALAAYSAGTVLQFLVVEDLFAYNRPVLWDLQDYGSYKDVLSTESYPQGKMFLFKPGLRSRSIIAGDRACRSVTHAASRILDRWKLKHKVKSFLRTRMDRHE